MSLPILDVVIGLSFIYLLLALICTTVNEMIAGWWNTRAEFMDKGIRRLLGGDDNLKRLFYSHPLIKSLAQDDKKICPSYIPANRFATVIMDMLSGEGKSPGDVEAVKQGLTSIGNSEFQASMKALIDHPDANAAAIHLRLETFFNDGMDRVSGWYKRNAQRNALLLAAAITLILNADTIHIVTVLWVNPVLRAAVVAEAQVRSQKDRPEELLPLVEYSNPQDPTASTPVKPPQSTNLSGKEQELLGQLTGWAGDGYKGDGIGAWLANLFWLHGLGWLLTALAVSLGAPFWFDLLNRFMNIRNAGRAPDEPRDKSRPAVV